MDSKLPEPPSPSILIVEDDAEFRPLISRALKQAGYEDFLAASGEDALDLIAAAEFDGLYCTIDLAGQVDGWEVGTTFIFIWPDMPTVSASAVQTAPPGRLRHGMFLRKPFSMDRLVRMFEVGAFAARAKRQLA
jgi:CheY-like chemotaxis protein